MIKFVNKKDRLAIYERAIEIIRWKQQTYMCPALEQAANELNIEIPGFTISLLFGKEYDTSVFPELHSFKPKNLFSSVWFFANEWAGPESVRAKRKSVLLDCVLKCVEKNHLPAFQNENLKKLHFNRLNKFTS